MNTEIEEVITLTELFPFKLCQTIFPGTSGEKEFAMIYDDFPLDPSPSDVDSKEGVASDDDIVVCWEGRQITYAEFADEINAIQRGEIPLPAPELKEMSEEDQRLLEAMEPSDVMMDDPIGEFFPENEELCQLLRKQNRQFAGDGDIPRKRVRPIPSAGQITSGRGVARRIRRPRGTGNIQKRPRRTFTFR